MLSKEERAISSSSCGIASRATRTSSDLRVVYGMALCVNLEAQEAMEELAEAVSLDPNSFIAHLKMGELWMRLRVCTKAQDHTRYAVDARPKSGPV